MKELLHGNVLVEFPRSFLMCDSASPERELNETKASNSSEKEFGVMVIRMLKQLDDKYTRLNEKFNSMRISPT